MIVLFVILFLIAFYFYATNNHDYWARRNVKHDPPIPLFGNHLRNLLGIRNISEIAEELYNKYPNEKVVGYYIARTPALIIRDLDIIRNILSKDFSYFYLRGQGRDGVALMENLFHSDGDRWKLLRQRLTPAFTTAKLKNMFPLVVKCAEKLQDKGKDIVLRGGECDARDLMARFTIEFIGMCGFGIEMDTINEEQNIFRDLGRHIVSPTLKIMILIAIWELFPELRRFMHVSNDVVEKMVKNIFKKVRKERNYKPCGRNDFIDLLLELEAKGKIKGESIEKMNPDGTPMPVEMEMDIRCMVAQVFVFFAAGFDTSSSATSATLHELAFNPEIQVKVQEEIDQVLSQYGNKLSYDAVAEMPLLDMALKEAMRIFPSLGTLNRVCAKRYKIPGSNVTIEPGVKILIPIKGIHMDEKYFDNPREFRLERFSSEETIMRHHFAYLPFGEGPRACIGERLGHMQSMAGLATILHKFTVEPAASTRRELEVDHTQNTVQSVKKVPLILKLRSKP